MKKIILLYNPASGKKRFSQRLDSFIELCQARRLMVIPYRTQADEDPRLPDFIRAANPDGVMAAGGDGTLHYAVNLLLKNDLSLPLAVIGSGTSNDFATYLGVKNDLGGYLDHIAQGRTRPVDVGWANGEYFINVASAGMLTAVPHKINPRLKHSLGKLAYYLGGIREVPRFRPLRLTITADGKKYEETAFLFVVVNSDAVGSLRRIATGIAIDDGLLDLLLVRWDNMAGLVSLTASLAAGRGSDEAKNVLHLKAKDILIAAAEQTESDLDGEKGPLLPLSIKTVPKALSFFY